jgi:hypothetical protein
MFPKASAAVEPAVTLAFAFCGRSASAGFGTVRAIYLSQRLFVANC